MEVYGYVDPKETDRIIMDDSSVTDGDPDDNMFIEVFPLTWSYIFVVIKNTICLKIHKVGQGLFRGVNGLHLVNGYKFPSQDEWMVGYMRSGHHGWRYIKSIIKRRITNKWK